MICVNFNLVIMVIVFLLGYVEYVYFVLDILFSNDKLNIILNFVINKLIEFN